MRNREKKNSALPSGIGALCCVEFASGFLQAYYTPMFTDIARHLDIHDAEVNWLEGSQFALAALVVPALARLGDMHGHRRALLIAMMTVIAGGLVLPFTTSFPLFLAGWALLGVSAVWLPLEIAIMWNRRAHENDGTVPLPRVVGVLIAALEGGAIAGALAGGSLVSAVPLSIALLLPPILVGGATLLLLIMVPDEAKGARGTFDGPGFALLSGAFLTAIIGMNLLRSGSATTTILIWLAVSGSLFGLFAYWESRAADPLIDVRAFRSRGQAPVFLAAGLFGMSVLGAQAPLSTFARTDPSVHGFGLGATSLQVSLLVGGYVIATACGALTHPSFSRRASPQAASAISATAIAVGFLTLTVLHEQMWHVATMMLVIGFGAGGLMAALPSAAAAAAPRGATGVATGLTNSVKTLGGVVAACAFGLILGSGSAPAGGGDAAAFESYVATWVFSGTAAALAALILAFSRRRSVLLTAPRDDERTPLRVTPQRIHSRPRRRQPGSCLRRR